MGEKKQIIVQLTEEQLDIILGLIDCHTQSNAPDYFYDPTTGCVQWWTADPTPYSTGVQKHLDDILVREKLDF